MLPVCSKKNFSNCCVWKRTDVPYISRSIPHVQLRPASQFLCDTKVSVWTAIIHVEALTSDFLHLHKGPRLCSHFFIHCLSSCYPFPYCMFFNLTIAADPSLWILEHSAKEARKTFTVWYHFSPSDTRDQIACSWASMEPFEIPSRNPGILRKLFVSYLVIWNLIWCFPLVTCSGSPMKSCPSTNLPRETGARWETFQLASCSTWIPVSNCFGNAPDLFWKAELLAKADVRTTKISSSRHDQQTWHEVDIFGSPRMRSKALWPFQ